MDIAIRKAEQWHGLSEKEIPDNYHVLAVKENSHTLRGTPWCASFVTYCLKEAGNIAALGGNQGGKKFGGGTIKISEYSLSGPNAKFEGKTQFFYKLYYPVGWLIPKNDLQLTDIDAVNSQLLKINIKSESNEGGGL